MKKIFRVGAYVKVIYDGTNERLYPISTSQLSEFSDTFIVENRDNNQPKDTQVSFLSLDNGTWFQEDGTTAWTVSTLRDFFTGLSATVDIDQVQEEIHGYFNIKTDTLDPTQTILLETDESIYVDVNVLPNALVDKRPKVMVDASATAFDNSSLLFNLEGLDTSSFGNVLVDFDFDPDEDEGELSLKLLFNNHSGVGSTSEIESIVGVMTQGADQDYSFQQAIEFPITESIKTNGAGDAGQCKLQIKSTVAGTIKVKSITYFLYK